MCWVCGIESVQVPIWLKWYTYSGLHSSRWGVVSLMCVSRENCCVRERPTFPLCVWVWVCVCVTLNNPHAYPYMQGERRERGHGRRVWKGRWNPPVSITNTVFIAQRNLSSMAEEWWWNAVELEGPSPEIDLLKLMMIAYEAIKKTSC